jgi:hypothetical protein
MQYWYSVVRGGDVMVAVGKRKESTAANQGTPPPPPPGPIPPNRLGLVRGRSTGV